MQKPLAMPSAPVQPELINGIDLAVQDIFLSMFNVPASLLPADKITSGTGLSSIIGFAGRISGFLALHFDRKTACMVAAGLLGMELEEVDDTVRDAMAEMVNMLAGGLKKKLSKNEEIFKLSLPSVIEGKEYSTYPPANTQNLLVGVSAGPYQFKVQLVVEGV